MQEIITAFEEFMGKHGQYYSEFYVGIASDPNDRLTNGHGVTTTTPNIYWTSPLQTEVVRALEKHFLDKGAKGGPGGGDKNTCYLYCYKISPSTREWGQLSRCAGLQRARGEGGATELWPIPYGARKAHLAHNNPHANICVWIVIYFFKYLINLLPVSEVKTYGE